MRRWMKKSARGRVRRQLCRSDGQSKRFVCCIQTANAFCLRRRLLVAEMVFWGLIHRQQKQDDMKGVFFFFLCVLTSWYGLLLNLIQSAAALKPLKPVPLSSPPLLICIIPPASLPLHLPPSCRAPVSAVTLLSLLYSISPSFLFCPSEDVGIHLSIHLSAPLSLTSGNDEERQRGSERRRRRRRRVVLWKMGSSERKGDGEKGRLLSGKGPFWKKWKPVWTRGKSRSGVRIS